MHTAPLILLRIAPLTFDDLTSLSCRRVLALAKSVEAVSIRLRERRQARCDALHGLAPKLSGPGRHAVLDLKRAIYNDRTLDKQLWAQAEEAVSGEPALLQELKIWALEVVELERARAEGPSAVQADWETMRRHLALIWRNDLLRRGVLHAQPHIYAELCKDDNGTHPWLATSCRRIESSLLAYVYRAATKTSPFSSLTLTAVGTLSVDVKEFPRPDLQRVHSMLVLAPAVVGALHEHLLHDPRSRDELPIRLPVVMDVVEDEIVFITSDETAASLERTGHDVIRTLSHAPLAMLVVVLLRADSERFTAPSLARAMAEILEMPEHVFIEAVSQLCSCGLVRRTLDYHAVGPSALGGLAKAAEAVNTEFADNVRCAAERLLDLAPCSPATQAAEIPSIITELASFSDRITSSFTENTVFDRCAIASPLPIPNDAVEHVLPILRNILKILPLFDADIGLRCVIQDALDKQCRNGADLSVLAGFRESMRHVAEGHGSSTGDLLLASGERHPTTCAAATCREALVAELRAMLGAAGRAGVAQVALSDDFFRRWKERADAFAPTRTRPSASFLGQFVETASSAAPLFALNAVLPGYGTLAAAWASLDSKNEAGALLHTTLRERLRQLDPEGEVVEIAAALGFGGQVREPVTPSFLTYPGEPVHADPCRMIDWQDLTLTRDPTLDLITLRRKSSGRRVLPIHLGTLSPTYFPPFYRFLVGLGPAFSPTFSLIDLIEEELTSVERGTLRRYPQVVAGPVIVSRMTWCLPAAQLPARRNGLPSFDDFLALRRWAADLGLPKRVFVTGAQTGDLLREGMPLRTSKRARKPFFLDFDDFVSCALFNRFARKTGPTVRFTDMVPMPEQSPFHCETGRRAVECVIDLLDELA